MTAPRLQVYMAALAILGSAVLAQAMIPRQRMARSVESFNLETIIPERFGEWTYLPRIRLIQPVEPGGLVDDLYSQVLGRGYVDRDGHVVMLLVAYGPSQSGQIQLHRPEVCYVASGFRILQAFQGEIAYRDDISWKIRRLSTQLEQRVEPISYWMRVGNDIVADYVAQKTTQLKYSLRGILPDGILVRVSNVDLPAEAAYALHDRFIRDLLDAIGPKNLQPFIGDPEQWVAAHGS